MKFIWLGLIALFSAQCAQLQSDFREAAITANAGGEKGADNCRTYPTGYTTGGNTYTCAWNGGAIQFICNGPSNIFTLQYPSLKKFIDEPKIVGRFFLNSVTITGTGPLTVTYSYDSSERLSGSSVAATGITSMTYVYNIFDGQGRPTSGLYNLSASGFTCVNANIMRSYNDGARTMTESISGGTGILCSPSSSISTYDAETGIDTTVVATPGGTTTKSITGKSSICE